MSNLSDSIKLNNPNITLYTKYICIILLLLLLLYYSSFYILKQCLSIMAKNIIIAFNKCKVDYWIDFGTLLGLYREGDIILYDTDVDIVVLDYPENHEKIKKAFDILTKQGYCTNKEDWSAYRVFYLKYMYADIYINKIDTIKKEYIGATGETSNILFEYIDNCSYFYWNKYDIHVRAPKHIKETLIYRYGADFMTPKKHFKGRNL